MGTAMYSLFLNIYCVILPFYFLEKENQYRFIQYLSRSHARINFIILRDHISLMFVVEPLSSSLNTYTSLFQFFPLLYDFGVQCIFFFQILLKITSLQGSPSGTDDPTGINKYIFIVGNKRIFIPHLIWDKQGDPMKVGMSHKM